MKTKIVAFVCLATFVGLVNLATADDSASKSRKVMTSWLDAAKRNDWKSMLSLSQLTWKSTEREPEKLLSITYPFPILSWKIVNTQPCGVSIFPPGSCYDFDINAEVKGFDGKPGTMVARPRVICETGPRAPSASGKCGVNPPSALLKWK